MVRSLPADLHPPIYRVSFRLGIDPVDLSQMRGPLHALHGVDPPQLLRKIPHDQHDHDRELGWSKAGSCCGPCVQGAQERPEVLQGAGDELEPSKSFVQFTQRKSAEKAAEGTFNKLLIRGNKITIRYRDSS